MHTTTHLFTSSNIAIFSYTFHHFSISNSYCNIVQLELNIQKWRNLFGLENFILNKNNM